MVRLMYRVCTAEKMREVDRRAIEEENIDSMILMENAGLRCVDVLISEFGSVKGKKIGVFCGKGNNGGDGFVIARHLDRLGACVFVYTVCGREFTHDAGKNFNMLANTSCVIKGDTDFTEYEIPLYDIVIDAIFGTGIKGNIEGVAAEVIEAMNTAGFVMAVDVPSGINSDTGEVFSPCVKADFTVTFAAYKAGLLLYPAADYCGKIQCVDICIPQKLLGDEKIFVTDEEFFKEVLPKRYNNSQKGDYGKVLIIAGSVGMSGAAYMAAQAALTSGSGIVSIACPEEINTVLEQKTTEVMTIPQKSVDGHLCTECIDDILEILPNYDAVLFGPGLGRSDDIAKILEAVTKNCEVPLIIDADGLFTLANNLSLIEKCNCSLILTPHEMEMSRLKKCELSYVIKNRLSVSKDFAEENGVTLILKGNHTIVTSLDGTQYINIKGNSGMATGGSGDVLAGMCASFAARGVTEEKTAAISVYLHSVAGDLARDKYGEDSVTACRIEEHIPDAVKTLLR